MKRGVTLAVVFVLLAATPFLVACQPKIVEVETVVVQKVEVIGLDPEVPNCLWVIEEHSQNGGSLLEGEQVLRLSPGTTWFALRGSIDGHCVGLGYPKGVRS